jgi:hypothetical protein
LSKALAPFHAHIQIQIERSGKAARSLTGLSMMFRQRHHKLRRACLLTPESRPVGEIDKHLLAREWRLSGRSGSRLSFLAVIRLRNSQLSLSRLSQSKDRHSPRPAAQPQCKPLFQQRLKQRPFYLLSGNSPSALAMTS